jgi:3-hydroxybutyryl-CoA dehydratase
MKNLQVGQSAATKRTFSAEDLVAYAALAGIKTRDERTVPGPLLGGMFSYLLGTTLPGRGTNYLKQRLEFPTPAFVGDELTATVEIIRLRPEKELVNLQTICTNPRGEIVCRGEALVLVKDLTDATA